MASTPGASRGAGIFSGMFSRRDSQAVLDDIGDKFPLALVRATQASRADFAQFRRAFPGWMPGMFERDLANLIHPRIWAHLTAELDGVDGVTLIAQEPVREIGIQSVAGRGYVARVKRHSARDRIRSYPTRTDVVFWGGAQATFDGLDRVPLAVGYRWDRELREIGAPVISYREGKENVIWAVALDAGESGGVQPLTYTPIQPNLPQLDLLAASEEDARRDAGEFR